MIPCPANNLDLEVCQGHGMVPNERACHKDQHAKYKCSIINTSEDMSQVFVTDRQTDTHRQMNEF